MKLEQFLNTAWKQGIKVWVVTEAPSEFLQGYNYHYPKNVITVPQKPQEFMVTSVHTKKGMIQTIKLECISDKSVTADDMLINRADRAGENFNWVFFDYDEALAYYEVARAHKAHQLTEYINNIENIEIVAQKRAIKHHEEKIKELQKQIELYENTIESDKEVIDLYETIIEDEKLPDPNLYGNFNNLFHEYSGKVFENEDKNPDLLLKEVPESLKAFMIANQHTTFNGRTYYNFENFSLCSVLCDIRWKYDNKFQNSNYISLDDLTENDRKLVEDIFACIDKGHHHGCID